VFVILGVRRHRPYARMRRAAKAHAEHRHQLRRVRRPTHEGEQGHGRHARTLERLSGEFGEILARLIAASSGKGGVMGVISEPACTTTRARHPATPGRPADGNLDASRRSSWLSAAASPVGLRILRIRSRSQGYQLTAAILAVAA
jgi:hypothetical protein